jgi:hypothetical protein
VKNFGKNWPEKFPVDRKNFGWWVPTAKRRGEYGREIN